MDIDRDTTRIVRSWLEEGRTALPDHILDAVLDRVPTTPQRRPLWLARRASNVSTPVRFMAAAAAIVVASVVGISILAGGRTSDGGIGGVVPTQTPVMTPAPTPTPSSTARPSPSPLSVVVSETYGPLVAGATYVTPDPFPVRVSFTAPGGWQGNVGGPYAVFLGTTDTDGVTFQDSIQLFADPCHPNKGFMTPAPGPSAAQLANALAKQPVVTVTKPVDTTIGGLPAKELTVTVPKNVNSCQNKIVSLWLLPLGDTADMTAGEVVRLWVIDVAGQQLVVGAIQLPGQSQTIKAQTQAVIDSLRIAAP